MLPSTVALVSYEPTEAGKAIFRPVETKTYGGTMRAFPSFCLGSGKLNGIVQWTDLTDVFGRTITEVTYRFSATGLPASLAPDLRTQLTTPQEAKATLVRANDGWHVAE